MRLPREIHFLICFVLIVSYRKSQARTIKKALRNSPSQRNVLPKLSSKLHKDDSLHGTTSCVQLGLRNMICVYNKGRLGDLPSLYDDQQFSDEQFNIWPDFQVEPNEQEDFVDLTRVDKDHQSIHSVGRSQFDDDSSFSEDYLDVSDLSITRKVDTGSLFTPRTYSVLTIFLTSPIREQRIGRRVFSLPDPRMINFLTHKKTRNDDDYEENTSAEEDDSSEDESSPKRFKVKQQSESSEESEEEPKKVPKRVQKEQQKEQKEQSGKSNYVYMQGPTRLLGPDRRRLPHFLPKQFHWNREDIHKLPYLWFHGPQGQFAGLYRKPF